MRIWYSIHSSMVRDILTGRRRGPQPHSPATAATPASPGTPPPTGRRPSGPASRRPHARRTSGTLLSFFGKKNYITPIQLRGGCARDLAFNRMLQGQEFFNFFSLDGHRISSTSRRPGIGSSLVLQPMLLMDADSYQVWVQVICSVALHLRVTRCRVLYHHSLRSGVLII